MDIMQTLQQMNEWFVTQHATPVQAQQAVIVLNDFQMIQLAISCLMDNV